MNALPKSQVRFIENGHTYWLGIDELVGVTTIIRKVLFPCQYEGIDEDVLANAAQRGTTIHNLIQAYERCDVPSTSEDGEYYDILQAWEEQRPKGLFFVADEYLVSDNEKVAGKIDLVFTNVEGDYVLCDIKTTSEKDAEYLSWQLSFYADMFEKQTGHKVAYLLGAWWDRGHARWRFFDVGRKKEEKVLEVKAAFFGGLTEQVNAVPAPLIELGRIYAGIYKTYKDAEAQKKELESRTMAAMEECGMESFETPDVKVTKVAPTTSIGFDVDAFKAQYPDLYKQFLTKETARKGSVRITLRKKS